MFGRSPKRLINAVFDRRHYASLLKSPSVYVNLKQSFVEGYVMQKGSYPRCVEVRTPTGIHSIEVLNPLDMFTIHEIFVWEIYQADCTSKVIADFGSNIGISQAYFLTRNLENTLYGFEPVPKLYSQLCKNSSKFEGRVFNQEVAISSNNGFLSMGIESSGRYGGIGLELEDTIQVKAVNAETEIQKILDVHDLIDILKIDIEGLEAKVIDSLSKDSLSRIQTIYIEAGDDTSFFPEKLRDFFKLSSPTGICKYTNQLLPVS